MNIVSFSILEKKARDLAIDFTSSPASSSDNCNFRVVSAGNVVIGGAVNGRPFIQALEIRNKHYKCLTLIETEIE